MATSFLANFCDVANGFIDKQVAVRSKGSVSGQPRPLKLEHLYGCASCNYSEVGCKYCWDNPFASRPAARAKPHNAHYQDNIPAAPTFRPTLEEFQDPFAYLAKIAPEAAKAGIAHIVPPEGWEPPIQLLDQDTGTLRKDYRVPVRIQPTHLLCKRYPTPSGAPPLIHTSNRLTANKGNSGSSNKDSPTDDAEAPAAAALATGGGADADGSKESATAVASKCQDPAAQQQQMAGRCSGSGMRQQMTAAVAAAQEIGKDVILNPAHWDAVATAAAATDGQFGYEHLEEPLSLFDFHRYADWAKRRHFGGPLQSGSRRYQTPSAQQQESMPEGGPAVPAVHTASNAWRSWPVTPAARAARGVACKWVPGTSANSEVPWQEPSIEEVEAEFWRIVEAAEEQVEALYGQDVDTATYGSAFPTTRELAQAEAKQCLQGLHSNSSSDVADDNDIEENPIGCKPSCRCGFCQLCVLRKYTADPWNINNIPQARGSVLRFVREDVGGKPITGLMVPWVYVGSCFSAFCWHIEDHGLYSVNFNHMGAPKIWYGVPATAAAALEVAMRDALPHLFERDALLMHKLVTMMSPSQLSARGVPICRAVQIPGSFVVTFPDAYHAGFNSGFNVAEAVNFAAPDWLPNGSSSVVRYRRELRYMTFSHDAMLINVIREAIAHAAAAATQEDKQQQEQQCQREPLALTLPAPHAPNLLPKDLQATSQSGLRAMFSMQLESTVQQVAAAEVAAAQQHWESLQQQRQQQSSATADNGSTPVKRVAPADPATATADGWQQVICGSHKSPAVEFCSSPLDSSFWWDWYSDNAWAEAAQAADEPQTVLFSLLEHSHGIKLPHGKQQGQQQQGGFEHHLSAASQQYHHQGQRERMFTMRSAPQGAGASNAAAAIASCSSNATAGPPAEVVANAARTLATITFARPAAASSNSKKAAVQSQAAAAVSPEAAVQAMSAYFMALAECRRQRLLHQPPSAELAKLAVGELVLRLELEQQRQQACTLVAGITRTTLMQGNAVALDPATGVHTNTQGVECATCGCDLSLAAVVSDDDPGRAVCPAHITDLDGTRSQLCLLLRFAPGQLERLLAVAMKLIPGATAAISDARQRQSWVAAGRFIGGAVLSRPAHAASYGVDGSTRDAVAAAAAAAANTRGTVVVKQEADVAASAQQQQYKQEGQEPASTQQQQQPALVEVKLLGRLYDPSQLDSKLFEDLAQIDIEALGGGEAAADGADQADADSDVDEAMRDVGVALQLLQGVFALPERVAASQRQQQWQQWGLQQPRQQHHKGHKDDSPEHSSGDHSSGSWWEGEVNNQNDDEFGLYRSSNQRGSGRNVRSYNDGDGTSDDEFRPGAGRNRKRRRVNAGNGAAARKRAAVSVAAAAAPVADVPAVSADGAASNPVVVTVASEPIVPMAAAPAAMVGLQL